METESAPDPAAVIVPVGLLVGAEEVRRGVDVHALDPDDYAVWALAHGSVGAIRSQRPWDRSALLTLADATGVVDAPGALDRLCADGLVVEVGVDPADREGFAARHVVTALTHGVGNTAEDTSLYGIGSGGEALIQLGFTEYDLWQFSALDDTLWQACCGAAAMAAPDATDDRALQILDRFLRALPGLLLTGTAYVDVAFRLGRPAGPSGRHREAAA